MSYDKDTYPDFPLTKEQRMKMADYNKEVVFEGGKHKLRKTNKGLKLGGYKSKRKSK